MVMTTRLPALGGRWALPGACGTWVPVYVGISAVGWRRMLARSEELSKRSLGSSSQLSLLPWE